MTPPIHHRCTFNGCGRIDHHEHVVDGEVVHKHGTPVHRDEQIVSHTHIALDNVAVVSGRLAPDQLPAMELVLRAPPGSYPSQDAHEALSAVVYELAKVIEARYQYLADLSAEQLADEQTYDRAGEFFEKCMTMIATAPLSQEFALRLAFGK